MLAVLALVLLLAGAAAGALALRLGLTGTLLAAYVVASGEIVLGAEVLSPFHGIGVTGYLVWEAVIACVALALWVRGGRPLPSLPRLSRVSLRRHPILLVLGVSVGLALVFELFLSVEAPPNNWDALTYHLSRAAAWYQNGSLGFFPSHTPRENVFPGNAEIQILFGMVFTGGDRLAAIPQFVAELALMLGIFGTSRRLGFGRAEAVFASLLFATLSDVVLEATTAQNDLVVSAYVLATAFFLLGRSRRELLLAAAALGLALGTKLTAFYALPLLALLLVLTLPRRRILEFAAAAAVGFAAFGSLVFVENTIHYHAPLGPSSERQQFTPTVTAGNTVSTTARTLYKFIDLSGYDGGVQSVATQQAVGKFVFTSLDIDPDPATATQMPFFFSANTYANEDVSYFGPLGALLLLPLAFGYIVTFVFRRTSRAKVVFALALPLFAVELALTYKYNGWLGRFMIVPVALGAVLAARVYTLRLVSGLCAGIGILFLFFALAHNERKPVGLDGGQAIWSTPRLAGEALRLPGGPSTFEAFDAIVPSDARVGVLFGDDDWDYPLYGPHLTRRLVVLPKEHPFRAARSLHLDWVVVGNVALTVAPDWAQAQVGDWKLFAPPGTAAAQRLASYVRST